LSLFLSEQTRFSSLVQLKAGFLFHLPKSADDLVMASVPTKGNCFQHETCSGKHLYSFLKTYIFVVKQNNLETFEYYGL